ncbi:MAG: TonB-dependent receptor, partial [Acidobacteriia bacterium]|nr:TonB-dependent receptor [Terriglobia bacterium]
MPGNNIAALIALHADPAAAKIQGMIPAPNVATAGNAPVNNYQANFPRKEFIKIPSIKIDQSIGNNIKLSGFYTWVQTDRDSGASALPYPMNVNRKMHVRTKTFRFNYDHTISPTIFNHLGIGYRRYAYPDQVETSGSYDSRLATAQAIPGDIETLTPDLKSAGKVAGLGLPGAQTLGFPVVSGLLTGGLGTGTNSYYYQDKPTVTESLAWARGQHMLKFGVEWKFDTYTNRNAVAAMSNYGFSAAQTGLPATEGQNLSGGSIGNAYASFLLGMTNSYQVGNVSDPQWRRSAYSWFAQDTFRLSQKLTIDFGLRWDWVSGWGELHDRETGWSPTTPIPTANNLMGGLVLAGDGPGRCNCKFGKSYPWAYGPRLGIAYKFQEKTVIRVGLGITYGAAPPNQYTTAAQSLGHGWNTVDGAAPAYGMAASQFSNGIKVDPAALGATNFSPGLRVLPTLVNAPQFWDQNLGRPPRLFNWNVSIQREISRDIVVEAAYVGSRGAWWRADGLQNFNNMTPEYLQSKGLDVHNATDRALLTSRIDSAAAAARGFTKPYPSFPSGSTVAQALRPYPMYLNAQGLWSPVGKNWYDSLQAKFTKRVSHGFTFLAAYTFSKSLADYEGSYTNVWNRGLQKALTSFDQPHMLAMSGTYRVPRLAPQSSRLLAAVIEDWQIGAVLRYSSGTPIQVPNAQSALSGLLGASVSTPANRVPGQALFLADPNSADPRTTFVLNPAAWTDPAPGDWGTAAKYYGDYRNRRRPDEQFSLSKSFRIREGVSFGVRFELFNAFNRLRLNSPTSGNAKATQVLSNGVPQSGFGYVDATSANGATNP